MGKALFLTSAAATSPRGQVRPRHALRQASNIVLQCCVVPLQFVMIALDTLYFLDDGVEAVLELVGMAVGGYQQEIRMNRLSEAWENTFSKVSVCRQASSPCLLRLDEGKMSARHRARTPHASAQFRGGHAGLSLCQSLGGSRRRAERCHAGYELVSCRRCLLSLLNSEASRLRKWCFCRVLWELVRGLTLSDWPCSWRC